MNMHGLTENHLVRITLTIRNKAARWHRDIERQELRSMADEAVARVLAGFDPAKANGMPVGAYVVYFGHLRMRNIVRDYRQHNKKIHTWSLGEWDGKAPGAEGLAKCAVDELLAMFIGRDRKIIDMLAAGYCFSEVCRVMELSPRQMRNRIERIRRVTKTWMAGRAPGPMCCAYRAAREGAVA